MANNVKGLTIELSLDATKLKSGIEKTKKELSEEEKELAKINKALKFDPSSMDNLKKKAASLNTVIENLRKNIRLLSSNFKNSKTLMAPSIRRI